METKPLLYGLIGFFIGGLLVSVAAQTFERNELQDTTSTHSASAELGNKNGDAFDKQFLKDMIIHHEGAVAMARLAEKQARHQEIKTLSRDIISAQDKEITQMKAWQSSWGYTVENDSIEHTTH